jgi:uncharacterized membrane protein YadS
MNKTEPQREPQRDSGFQWFIFMPLGWFVVLLAFLGIANSNVKVPKKVWISVLSAMFLFIIWMVLSAIADNTKWYRTSAFWNFVHIG